MMPQNPAPQQLRVNVDFPARMTSPVGGRNGLPNGSVVTVD
jgi:hypothetical protein